MHNHSPAFTSSLWAAGQGASGSGPECPFCSVAGAGGHCFSVTHPWLSHAGASSTGEVPPASPRVSASTAFLGDWPLTKLHQPGPINGMFTYCLPGRPGTWRKRKICSGKKTNSWGQGAFQPAELGYATGAPSWNVPETLRAGITSVLFQDGMKGLLATEENPLPPSLFSLRVSTGFRRKKLLRHYPKIIQYLPELQHVASKGYDLIQAT